MKLYYCITHVQWPQLYYLAFPILSVERLIFILLRKAPIPTPVAHTYRSIPIPIPTRRFDESAMCWNGGALLSMVWLLIITSQRCKVESATNTPVWVVGTYIGSCRWMNSWSRRRLCASTHSWIWWACQRWFITLRWTRIKTGGILVKDDGEGDGGTLRVSTGAKLGIDDKGASDKFDAG